MLCPIRIFIRTGCGALPSSTIPKRDARSRAVKYGPSMANALATRGLCIGTSCRYATIKCSLLLCLCTAFHVSSGGGCSSGEGYVPLATRCRCAGGLSAPSAARCCCKCSICRSAHGIRVVDCWPRYPIKPAGDCNVILVASAWVNEAPRLGAPAVCVHLCIVACRASIPLVCLPIDQRAMIRARLWPAIVTLSIHVWRRSWSRTVSGRTVGPIVCRVGPIMLCPSRVFIWASSGAFLSSTIPESFARTRAIIYWPAMATALATCGLCVRATCGDQSVCSCLLFRLRTALFCFVGCCTCPDAHRCF